MAENSKAIYEFLEEQKLDIESFANLCQLPVERIEAITAGRWTPSPQDREKIAQALQVSANDIIWGHTLDPRNLRYRRFGLKEDFNQ